MPDGLFFISEQQLKQPDHQRHGQDGKQRAQDIYRAGMRSIPVIELCHGGDRCTGGGNGRKVDRHQDGLAVRDPKGCVNCPKQQNDDQRNTQQTQKYRQIVARGAENLFQGHFRNGHACQQHSHGADHIADTAQCAGDRGGQRDVQQVQQVMAMMFRIVLYAPILGIGGVLKVLNTDSSMTWILGVAVGLILIVIFVLFQVAMPKFTILQTLIDRLNLVSREILTGIPVIRAFSREKHEEDRFEKANLDLTKTNLFVNRCMTFMMPIMMLIMNGVSVLIIYSGAHAVDNGTMQVGNVMAFIQYAMQIIMSFLMITAMSIMLPRANVAALRIDEVLKTEVSIQDPETPVHPSESVKGEIEFDHVSFAYPEAGENVLTDISFKAKKGQTIAVIGSTGSGKSTLINLIPRYYDVTKGSVKVDGVDVRDMTQKELRDKLGYVPQKGVLFSGTIDSNIRYGKPEITDAQVKEAAEVAQATEFIDTKPEKYESPVSQGGTNVSGGQKQRLSIARAIAKDPEIFIFDDSFSALDFKTDSQLRKALKEYTKDATTVIVAQRISTILGADQIIVLDDGHMAGIGTHKELMANCEVYQQIARSQLSEEELA